MSYTAGPNDFTRLDPEESNAMNLMDATNNSFNNTE